MIYIPEKYKKDISCINDEFMKLEGELGIHEAQVQLAQFLRANIGFTVQLLTGGLRNGIDLYPYQEILLKMMLNRNFSLNVVSRGGAKSYLAGMFCILQCIFQPNSRILICGPTFRTSKFIFQYIEQIVERKESYFLKSVFLKENQHKRTDIFDWKVNGGIIRAVPLSGEKLRGFRANILVIDEFLLMPKEIVESVLMPFLTTPVDLEDIKKVMREEQALLEDGLITEDQLTVFEDKAKMIGLSSASFTFEYLYKTFEKWVKNIYEPEDGQIKQRYFVGRLSYKALPKELIGENIVEEAKKEGFSEAAFKREFCAMFLDDSDSYFSAKKMSECTIPDGELPTTMIKGDPKKKYILAVDPNYSKSSSSDFFAMAVLELYEEKESSILVHGYKSSGGDLKQHIKYLRYIFDNFNIVLAIVDNADFQFLDACNESQYFSGSKLSLKTFDFDSVLEGRDYEKEITNLKNSLKPEYGCVFFKQQFSTDFIRRANQHLQMCIDYKRVLFASSLMANESQVFAQEKTVSEITVKNYTPFESVDVLMQEQDDIINETKKQCSLIEVKITSLGTQSFDLPQNLRMDKKSPHRARKDNYTVLLLGTWAVKCYYDSKRQPEQKVQCGFEPIMIF